MVGFKQNRELTLPLEVPLLVKENSFLTKRPDINPLPVYEDIKEKLPQPIWDGHSDYVACYWKTWQIAFSNLRSPIQGRDLFQIILILLLMKIFLCGILPSY